MRPLNKKIPRGFILIELLIALVMIAISLNIAMQLLFTAQRLQYQLYEQLKTYLATPSKKSPQDSTKMKGR